jgi:hypothetical protein
MYVYQIISDQSRVGLDGSSSRLDAGPDGAPGWESLRRNIMVGHRGRDRAQVLGTAGPPESESG